MGLLWKRPLGVLALFAVAMFSGLGCGKGSSGSEGGSEEETTSGDGPRVPIPGSGSGSFKADSSEFQTVVNPYGTSQVEIKKEGGGREVGLFIPGMEGTLIVLNETARRSIASLCSSTATSSTITLTTSASPIAALTPPMKMQLPAFLQHRTEGGKAGYSPNRPWWSSRT